MKTITQIYKQVVESIITEKLLNRDIEERIKTDKSYNPIALDFYKFLKTKNITYEFLHGTSGVAWEMMKKDGYMSSPFLRGAGEFEGRGGSDVASKGVNQIFFTTYYSMAKNYALRECKKFESYIALLNSIKAKYKFTDEFIKENNKPVVLKLTIPLYLLAEVGQSVYNERYRNEKGMSIIVKNIILDKDTSNEEKLQKLIEYIDNTKNHKNEFTITGLIPISRVNGFEMVKKTDVVDTPNIDTKENSNITEFIDAAANNDLAKVKQYIKNKIDINVNDSKALRIAANNGHLAIVKLLVENGANIHAMSDKAFRNAAFPGHLPVVKFLVEKGAIISILNNKALSHAISNKHLPVVKYRIEKGAKLTNIDIDKIEDESIKKYLSKVKATKTKSSKTTSSKSKK